MSGRDCLWALTFGIIVTLLIAGAVNSILAHQRIRNSVCVPIEALSPEPTPATSPRRDRGDAR